MGLTYKFTFTAPASKTGAELEAFLQNLQIEARSMGFEPTHVFTATFSTKEQREFSRRIHTTYRFSDEKLKGVVLPSEKQVWRFDSFSGDCWVLPEQAVVLVVTDEKHQETVFGFAWYPKMLNDINGRPLVEIPIGGQWFFSNFIQTPDPRYRTLVGRFAEAGYLQEVSDDFLTS